MKGRTVLGCLVAAGTALALTSAPALAQSDFPSKPVKLVIPYPPGGPTDLLGRLVAQGLSEAWKQPVVVENKPGASGTIGADQVAHSEPDGYTLALANNASNGTYELLNPSTTPYITSRDFAPVALVALAPQVMIVAAAAEMFKLATGTDLKHIPFNGAAPVMQAIVSGTVQMYVGSPSTVMPHVQAGKALAIGALSEQRLPSLPDLPTFKESGVDLVYNSWFGILAPAKTPEAILGKINADVGSILKSDAVKKKLVDLSFFAEAGSREEFKKIVAEETESAKQIIEAAKMEVK